jgi:hypothetical protein
MTTNLEFYRRDGSIYVEYKDKEWPMAEFLKLEEAKKIINRMYQKILMDYNDEIKQLVQNVSIKGEVVGAFIKKYFLKANKTFDVVIYEESNLVKFNLEM